MPKLKKSQDAEDRSALVRCIKAKQCLCDASRSDLAKMMGKSKETVSGRCREPDKFTLDELQKLCRHLHIEIVITEKGLDCR